MRWMAIAVVLAAGCGGTAAKEPFEGHWTVQVNGAAGDMTLAAQGADGISGAWRVDGIGSGPVAGAVGFDNSIGLAFADPTGAIPVDVTATVNGDRMSGVVHETPRGTFTATRN